MDESGIQSIVPHGENLIVGFWNGIIELENETIQRSLPHLDAEEMKTTVKSSYMCMLPKPESWDVQKYSTLIRRKRYRDLLLVGYEDGTVVGYTVN